LGTTKRAVPYTIAPKVPADTPEPPSDLPRDLWGMLS